jgi:hypothetical protein
MMAQERNTIIEVLEQCPLVAKIKNLKISYQINTRHRKTSNLALRESGDQNYHRSTSIVPPGGQK